MCASCCMGAAFTAVVSGDSSVSKTVWNELRTAQRERAIVSTGWEPADFVGGEVAHDNLDIGSSGDGATGLQTNLLAMVGSFINHTVDHNTTNAVVYWTVAEWQTETGLTNAGVFRRLTDPTQAALPAPTWLYGIAQEGDIVGAWIFEDLQAGYSALKWTAHDGNPSSFTNEVRTGTVPGTGNLVCSTAKSQHDSSWTSPAWAYTGLSVLYVATAFYEINGGPRYDFDSLRYRGQKSISGVSTNVGCYVDFYALVSTTGGGADTVFDIDGIGATPGNLFMCQAIGLATNATRSMTNWIDGVSWDTSPVDVMGWGCASATNNYGFSMNYTASGGEAFLKWDFSNSN